MKTVISALLLIVAAVPATFGQKWEGVVSNDDYFAPFRTVYRDVESIDFSTPRYQRKGSMTKHHVYQKHDMMNGVYYGGSFKVAGKYRTGVSVSSNDYSTVRRSSGSSGGTIHDRNQASKKRQLDRNAEFQRHKQEMIEEARQREEERKRREKEEDDMRAAIATAQANAQMQPITNARIAKDRYNATEGLNQARSASRTRAYSQMRGYRKPNRRMNEHGTSAADALKKSHSKRRVAPDNMQSSLHPKLLQNPVMLKKPKPYIYRKVPVNNKYEFTGHMTKTSIFIEPDTRFGVSDKYTAPKTVSANQGFRLSPDAVVTTGQPIKSEDFNVAYIPERPKSSIKTKRDKEFDEMMEEFFPELYKK